MPLLGGLGLIAIAFVIGSIAIGHGIRDRNQNNVIVVTGSAKKRITSDYVIWTLSVTSTQASATAAATELSGWTGKIRSFLTGQGVEPAELTVQVISPNSTEVQDYGVYDTSTLDKDVTAVVNVTFGVG